jgi:Glycosyl hydrolase family 26/PKD domain
MRICTVVCSLLIAAVASHAAQKFEPASGVILSGVDNDTYSNYYRIVPGYQPVIISTYAFLGPSGGTSCSANDYFFRLTDFSPGGCFATCLQALLAGAADATPTRGACESKAPDPGALIRINYTALLVGINMNQNPSGGVTDYTAAVAAGTYDHQIDLLGARLAEIKRPVFLRIGVECNGSWNVYNAANFVAAYRHVVTRLRNDGITNVAFVWNVNPDGNAYWQYYPGDMYVDWWSCNYLDQNETSGNNGNFWSNFIADAKAAGPNRTSGTVYPIMIAESGTGSGASTASWSTFYAPYFSFILNTANNIKAFVYTNYNWYTQGGNNQDMSTDPVLPGLWRNELAQKQWHNIYMGTGIVTQQTQAALLGVLGLSAPNVVYSGPTAVAANAPVTLKGTLSSGGTAPLSCSWQFLSGPATPEMSYNAGCSAPAKFPATGTYHLQLNASDAVGYLAAPVSFTVTASAEYDVPVYSGPTTASVNVPIVLNGSTSTTPGTGTISCAWQYLGGPGTDPGATAIFTWDGGCMEQATFSEAGTYVLGLNVSDSLGYPSQGPVIFTVTVN